MQVDVDAFNEFEAVGWQQRAADYDTFLTAITGQVVEPLLDQAGIGSGMRVLDVGCGPGHAAAACAARGAAVVGVDVAEAMVRLARARYPSIEFRQGDVHQLPLPDASYDAVVGNFVILHAGDPERAAAEMSRVLGPGGRLALSTWDSPKVTRLVGVFVDAAAEAGAVPLPEIPDGPPFFRFADEAEFTRLLSQAGLGEVHVRTVAFTHQFSDADELWRGISGATVRMRALVFGQPDAVRERIRAVFDRLVTEYADADGALTMPISVKIASGRRAL